MKNEERIMAEGTGGNMDNRQKEIITNTELNKGNTGVGKPVEKGGGREVEKPESVKKGSKLEEEGKNKRRYIDWDSEEGKKMDQKLKTFKNLVVEVEVDGKPVEKNASDLLDMMVSLTKKDLPFEQRKKVIQESITLRDKLEQKFEAGTQKGDDLRDVFSDKGVFYGMDMRKWLDQIKSGKIDIDMFAEEEMDVELDDKQRDEVNKLIKLVPLPEGVGAAPTITIDKDGKLTITPAPHGEEVGQVVPAPGEGGGVSKTPKTPETPGSESQGRGDGGKKKVIEEEEKKKFDWWKYGNGLLFLLILYLGVQGWYAKMVEQMSERAR